MFNQPVSWQISKREISKVVLADKLNSADVSEKKLFSFGVESHDVGEYVCCYFHQLTENSSPT